MTTSPVPSITDEQIAEIENYVNLYADPVIPPQVSYAEIAALIARLRAAEKDAARYRYWSRMAAHEPSTMARLIAHCSTRDEYDAAIDAAMTEAKP